MFQVLDSQVGHLDVQGSLVHCCENLSLRAAHRFSSLSWQSVSRISVIMFRNPPRNSFLSRISNSCNLAGVTCYGGRGSPLGGKCG